MVRQLYDGLSEIRAQSTVATLIRPFITYA